MSSIETKRNFIYENFLIRLHNNPNNIQILTDVDFRDLFRLYDEIFFHGEFRKYLNFNNVVQIKLGKIPRNRMAAGCCQKIIQNDPRGDVSPEKQICKYIIILSKPILTSVFSSPTSNKIETNAGLQCRDQLSCLQLTFEHELIHLLIYFRQIKERSHGPQFRKLAQKIFGHTDFRHTIGRGLQEDPHIHNQRVREYLRPGMLVSVYNARTKKTETYTVVQVPTRKNAKRFVGQRGTGHCTKRYRIPFVHVVLP